MSGLYYRAAQVADVSFPDRTIDLIVVPYETPTVVNDHGRPGVTEIVSRGAFDGIERRPNRIRVNRDHDRTRTCGRAVQFWTDRDEGLVAALRIARTELGDETLALADDQILDASAGFGLLKGDDGRVKPDAMVWETRERVRLNHLWLDHVALTAAPAYETANVLAVRHDEPEAPAPTPTPNLASLELQRWRDQLAAIDARYSRG